MTAFEKHAVWLKQVAIVDDDMDDLAERRIPDEYLITSYVTCACCNNVQVTKAQLRDAIERATDYDHFLSICDSYGPLHRGTTAAAN